LKAGTVLMRLIDRRRAEVIELATAIRRSGLDNS
jgi:hypothetical protein